MCSNMREKYRVKEAVVGFVNGWNAAEEGDVYRPEI